MTSAAGRKFNWSVALGLLFLSACAHTPASPLASACATVPATSAASPLPARPGPTAVRTTVPALPTPTPRPTVVPSPTPTPVADPFASVTGWAFPMDQDVTLLTGPYGNPIRTTWELAPDQADRATLHGDKLHALKPGGILLVGHAGDRIGYLFMAAYRPNVASYAVSPNTPSGNSKLDGVRIFNSTADWDAYYKSLFAPPPGSESWPSAPPPPPSTPPIDFTQHSLLLYQAAAGPNDDGIFVTDVSSDTIDLVVTGSLLEAEPHATMPTTLHLAELIPKVSASATVNIEHMPPEVVPSATPFPQAPVVPE